MWFQVKYGGDKYPAQNVITAFTCSDGISNDTPATITSLFEGHWVFKSALLCGQSPSNIHFGWCCIHFGLLAGIYWYKEFIGKGGWVG